MMIELVMEATNTLPDTATFDDIIEAIYIRLKIEKRYWKCQKWWRINYRVINKGDWAMVIKWENTSKQDLKDFKNYSKSSKIV